MERRPGDSGGQYEHSRRFHLHPFLRPAVLYPLWEHCRQIWRIDRPVGHCHRFRMPYRRTPRCIREPAHALLPQRMVQYAHSHHDGIPCLDEIRVAGDRIGLYHPLWNIPADEKDHQIKTPHPCLKNSASELP